MNPAVTSQRASLIRSLHARRKPGSIDLGLGEPTLKPDVAYFEYATRWVAENGCRYSSNIGDPELRERIAAHYRYPALDRPENVCITTGSQEAVYVTIKTVLDPAVDEMLLVEPAFSVYRKVAEVEGVRMRSVAMPLDGGFAMSAERILAAVGPQTRLIVLCSPCNPTGRVMKNAEVQRLAQALLDRPGPPIYILHDEIYRELTYVDDAGWFGDVYPYTIAINSLSKSNALTGLRLGWAIAPSDVMPELVKMHGWSTSCASTFAQRIALEIFEAKDLGAQLPWYAKQRTLAMDAAREAGLEFIEPDGAFYLCVNVHASDTLAFAEELIEHRGVVAIPAHIFGGELHGWLRTSFVASQDLLREGFSRIAALAAEPALR